ncbi:unnamed protein product [Durusdinium trenchii]|uniref:Uncharacterized protein n=2 Tax=Durusdinium trenchii TaxID=1381693 RepID=A0ABP0IXA8_9DINO
MPVFCGLLAVQFAVQPYLTRTFTDGLDAGACVAAVEVLKLLLCCLCLRLRHASSPPAWNWTGLAGAAGPAVLYVFANMAGTVASKSIDAVTCNVISQTKLLFTALLAVTTKPISGRKWVGIIVILLASVLTAADSDGQAAQAYWIGTAAAFASAMASAVAAVLAERALLEGRDPLVYTAELSLWGLFALLLLSPKSFGQLGHARPVSAVPLTTQALGGIFVGVVTKRFGSLNKSILLVVSLLMTGLLHVFLEGAWPSSSAVASILLVVSGLVIYKELDQQLPLRWQSGVRFGTLLGRPFQTDAWVKEYAGLP